jgi:predicted PurR-regulated permease PerM
VKNKKFEQYFMIGATAFAVIAASLLTAFILFHFSTIRGALETLGKILQPFTIGCAIAYLLTPLYNVLVSNLSYYLGKTKFLAGEKARGVSTILAMLLSIVGSLALVGGLVALVIPGFVESLTTISNSMNLYTQRINQWVNSFFADSPETARTVETWLNASSDQLLNWVKETILPNLQGMSQGLGSGVSSVFSSMLSGMVVAFRRCVISRARGPSTHQARSEPIIALPMPAHVADRP